MAANPSDGLERELWVLRQIAQLVPAMLAFWDTRERCLFANEAYRAWFGVAPERLPGTTLAELLGPEIYSLNIPYIEGALRGERQHFEREFADPQGGPSRFSQVDYVPVVTDGAVKGFVVLVQDVSRRKNLELELQRTVGELQTALSSVRTLSGLLPICAWCKKVRTDQGYYEQIESFITAHTDATFTHGICPECEARARDERPAVPAGPTTPTGPERGENSR
ncbi:MAG: PAS domain-containing protein [Myxococcales bacterium]